VLEIGDVIGGAHGTEKIGFLQHLPTFSMFTFQRWAVSTLLTGEGFKRN